MGSYGVLWGLAALVVALALGVVAQDIESLLDLLERLNVTTLVRVVLDSELAIGLLDLVGRCILLYGVLSVGSNWLPSEYSSLSRSCAVTLLAR